MMGKERCIQAADEEEDSSQLLNWYGNHERTQLFCTARKYHERLGISDQGIWPKWAT